MVFTAWAYGRGMSAIEARVRMAGLLGVVEAESRYSAGATEQVVRQLLDAAMAASDN